MAYEWTPIGAITALGGLHAFEGAPGSFSGNLDASFSPAVKLSDRWALLPSLSATYEGTRRLSDALGTATANQQRSEGRMGVRGVYGDPLSRWRFKPTMFYGVEFLKETKDEEWGRGLFDQRRLTLGGEIEVLLQEPWILRLQGHWFSAQYPNYTTLESQAAFQFQGRSITRELVGDRILDRDGYHFAFAGDAPLGARAIGTAKVAVVWSRFSRQRIVDEGGQFQREVREDVLIDSVFSARMPHNWNADLRALASLDFGIMANSSNQNGYDATRGKFLPGFYDSIEIRAIPAVTFIIGPVRRPVNLTLKVGWKSRQYPHRFAQNSSGAYSPDALSTTEWSGGISLTYPMARRVSLLFQCDRASAQSNQDFSPFYRYAYQSTTALAGVRWEW
jgi:hypothetical protein